MTNKEIAERLYITTNTVKRHLKSIFNKLDVHTRAAAAAKAVGAGA
jgi:DNA-binding NarL/FixJ family response regulator